MIKITAFLCFFLASLSNSYAQDDLAFLQDKYGDIVYSAIFSLPESKSQFLDIAGEMLWETYSPNYIVESIPNETKKNLNNAFMNLSSSEGLTERIENWVLSYHQFSHAFTIANIEYTMAAIYSQPETQQIFKNIIVSRKMESNISAVDIGTTLSSSETFALQYEALNLLSTLKIKDQLSYFDNLFNTLADLIE